MVSLKNNFIEKLIDRLFKMLNSKSFIEPVQVVSQISYLLLLRRENTEFWNHIKTGDESVIYEIQDQLISVQRQLANSYNLPPHVIESIEFKINKTEILCECVDIINSIYKEFENRKNLVSGSFTYYDIDGIIFDDLYEKAMHSSQKMMKRFGKIQNLFIPKHICKLMASLTQTRQSDRIYDPMCGSGGMLLSIYESSIIKEHSNRLEDAFDTDDDGFTTPRYSSLLNSSIALCGSDTDIIQLLLAALNFQLRGIQKANLQSDDFIQKGAPQKFDVIIANPPFGQKLDKPYQNNDIETKNVEIAFIDRIISSLSPNGKSTIIVSEGFLSNANSQYVRYREKLLTRYRLEAVISLPSGIFHNTTAKSSILILTNEKNEKFFPAIWFYELQSDGYTSGVKRRTKEYPLPGAVTAFNKRKDDTNNQRTEVSFFVPLEEIKENDYNLSYNRYKQFSYEKQDFGNVNEIMREIINNEKDIQDTLKELESSFIWKQ